MPRTALRRRVHKLIQHALDERPPRLLHTDTPQTVRDILSVTDKGEVILKEILPVHIHFPALSFARHHQLLAAYMIALCIHDIVPHHAAALGEEHMLEIPQTAA